MKIRSILLLLLLCHTGFALPIGNPAEPSLLTESFVCSLFDECVSVRAGFYGDYVFNRYLEVDDSFNRVVDVTKINTNAGYLALNYCNWLDLFATVGASNVWIQTPSTAFRERGLAAGELFTITTNTSFSWSVGVRAALIECACFTLGVEGQYFQTCLPLNYVKEEADLPIYVGGSTMQYQEGQVGIALSRTFYAPSPCIAFIPYIGLKAAWASVDMNNLRVVVDNIQTDTYVLHDLQSTKRWGYAVGITTALNKVISISAERRFGDENGLYVNGQIRF